jgi:hypothetical protein
MIFILCIEVTDYFTWLCVWLNDDKCVVNFQSEPRADSGGERSGVQSAD